MGVDAGKTLLVKDLLTAEDAINTKLSRTALDGRGTKYSPPPSNIDMTAASSESENLDDTSTVQSPSLEIQSDSPTGSYDYFPHAPPIPNREPSILAMDGVFNAYGIISSQEMTASTIADVRRGSYASSTSPAEVEMDELIRMSTMNNAAFATATQQQQDMTLECAQTSRRRAVSFGSERTRVYHPDETTVRVLVRRGSGPNGQRILSAVSSNSTKTDDVEYVLSFLHPEHVKSWFSGSSGKQERRNSLNKHSELIVGADGVIRGKVLAKGVEPPQVRWTANNWQTKQPVNKFIRPPTIGHASPSNPSSAPSSTLSIPFHKRFGLSPNSSSTFGESGNSSRVSLATSNSYSPKSEPTPPVSNDGLFAPLTNTSTRRFSINFGGISELAATAVIDLARMTSDMPPAVKKPEEYVVASVIPELQRVAALSSDSNGSSGGSSSSSGGSIEGSQIQIPSPTQTGIHNRVIVTPTKSSRRASYGGPTSKISALILSSKSLSVPTPGDPSSQPVPTIHQPTSTRPTISPAGSVTSVTPSVSSTGSATSPVSPQSGLHEWKFEIDAISEVLPELERLVGDAPHEPVVPEGWSPLRVGEFDYARRAGFRPRNGVAMSFQGIGAPGSIESVRWSGVINIQVDGQSKSKDTAGLIVTLVQIINPSK
ncbi:hypothetical protein SmJEL517_g04406 [Synchytrium microbalum]|uniref:Uncharacterized protein n=1 Tax=Synchytrium microbalum TaxID=1806994 RepID=A0A507BU65_9FUNG|nr:uncharacterized protein SmJEL517_g04406 [Synchytrium microbalum]TPX32497.1 hypothetical protein SmJEL517_g04406 [Synchytrium microbalum]